MSTRRHLVGFGSAININVDMANWALAAGLTIIGQK
jgi:hypothetical protein